MSIRITPRLKSIWSPVRTGPGRWFFRDNHSVSSPSYSKGECHRRMHARRMALDTDYRTRIHHNQMQVMEKVALRRLAKSTPA